MLSYSANKQDNKLINITKITAQMTATDKVDEYIINVPGEWFYFREGADKALYEAIGQTNDSIIVKRNDDVSIMDAFSQAIALGWNSYTIYAPQVTEQPVLNESQIQEVQQKVVEKLILPEIIQPIVVQSNEQIKPQFQLFTADPQFEEKATYAETWTWQNIALPTIAKGVKFYNDNIPADEVRPREYVVMSVDDEVRDINFANDKNNNEESFCTLIIQGLGYTFNNWVVEISKFVHGLLRDFRKKGDVHSINNRKIGFDETTQILSRTITFWLQYNL